MARMYPTLEDLKVDEICEAQKATLAHQLHNPQPVAAASSSSANSVSSLYPSLHEYMGINLKDPEVQRNLSVYVSAPSSSTSSAVATRPGASSTQVVAPVSQGSLGMVRAEIKQGINQRILCKDGKGLLGIRVQDVDNGIFIAFVAKDTPAALGQLKFGQQILEINDQPVAGWSRHKTMNFLKKADAARIKIVLRDRPFERPITINKDSAGLLGFTYKNGRITNIVKDSSAARNGLLTDHQLCEVDGQCVVGMSDKDIAKVFEGIQSTGTVTIMPCFLYDHIVKKIGNSLFKKADHSIPDV